MNKSRPYLHYETENNYISWVALALFPLLIYGFYKNGILPFISGDASFFKMLRPIFFPLVGLGVGILTDLIMWWKSNQKEIWTYYPIYGFITFMTLPISANILVSAILLLIIFCILRNIKKVKLNLSPLIIASGILLILLSFVGKVTFQNASELSHHFVYSLFDNFFGRNIGGICTTSIFWSVSALIFLCFNYYYKKEIPFTLIGSYVLCCTLFEVIFPTGDLLKMILNSSVIFAGVFVAPEIKHSPYMDLSKMIYGVMVGVLGFFLTRFISSTIGIYIALLVLSPIVPILDNIAIVFGKK